jgi:hypothetical protein
MAGRETSDWHKPPYTDESTLKAGRGGKPRKVRRPTGTENVFEDRYLARTFSPGRISIFVWTVITHSYHSPLIFIRKCTPEERTSN